MPSFVENNNLSIIQWSWIDVTTTKDACDSCVNQTANGKNDFAKVSKNLANLKIILLDHQYNHV